MYPKGKIRTLVAIKTGVGLTRIPFLRGKIANFKTYQPEISAEPFDGQNVENIHTKIWRRYKIFQKFTLL